MEGMGGKNNELKKKMAERERACHMMKRVHSTIMDEE
jgi:hypothetical protein